MRDGRHLPGPLLRSRRPLAQISFPHSYGCNGGNLGLLLSSRGTGSS